MPLFVRGWNSLDPLDPDAVVCDVQVVQDVGRLVLAEDFVDFQHAFEDAGLPWTRGAKRGKSGVTSAHDLGCSTHERKRWGIEEKSQSAAQQFDLHSLRAVPGCKAFFVFLFFS